MEDPDADGTKRGQQLENETSDHGNPKLRLPDPFLIDLGRWSTKKGSSNQKNHNDPKRPCWTPFCKISAAERSKKSPGSFNLIKKRSQKSTPKFFFKTVENSMVALKEHQANSKISSGLCLYHHNHNHHHHQQQQHQQQQQQQQHQQQQQQQYRVFWPVRRQNHGNVRCFLSRRLFKIGLAQPK